MVNRNSRLDLTRINLLAVEDNPQAMEVMSQILMGFGVVHATKCVDTAEAIQKAGARQFDLVLADDDPLTQGGLELLRALRGDPSGPNYTVHVLLLSANTSEARVIAARDAGASFIVAKPLSPRTLLTRIEWIARNNRSFVTSEGYRGPDRRFKSQGVPDGLEERRADALKLIASPERQLEQAEIDSLFG